ncbi:putative glycerol kinase 5 [Oscarella lobularis]|uniref:putative glycerol kinase 5 n=1 Tax=Oscarella lobularis TaxID=121494 RepID=UPI003313A785
MAAAAEKFVVSVDVGTTNIKACVYDKVGTIRGEAREEVSIECPRPQWAEMDEERLWEAFQSVTKKAVLNASIGFENVACLGIATQRGTFITWNKQTGKPLHKFICWHDLRCAELCKRWNSKLSLKALHAGGSFMHFFTKSNRFMAAKVLHFYPRMAISRLAWVLENIDEAKELAAEENLLFGTIDTWLLWKISAGRLHVTDYSNASSTGMYDPWKLEWSKLIFSLFKIPDGIAPKVEDTSQEFCVCPESLFGASFPISAIVADQQSSFFGNCCWARGDVKITSGTGTFIDVNTSTKPHASMTGMLPLVGWKIKSEVVFVAEGQASATGKTVEWGRECGFYPTVEESSQVAKSVEDAGGVCFIPGFSGILVPFNDPKACCGILGITPQTKPSHLARALLESIAFRIKQIFDTANTETVVKKTKIKIDGGISTNDFVMQLVADLTGCTVERQSDHRDMTCFGAAMLAGLAVGFWSRDDLENFGQAKDTFTPQRSQEAAYERWAKVVPRCLEWYAV